MLGGEYDDSGGEERENELSANVRGEDMLDHSGSR